MCCYLDEVIFLAMEHHPVLTHNTSNTQISNDSLTPLPSIERKGSDSFTHFSKLLKLPLPSMPELAEVAFEEDLQQEPHDTVELNELKQTQSNNFVIKCLSFISLLFLLISFILLGFYTSYNTKAARERNDCYITGNTSICPIAEAFSESATKLLIAMSVCLSCFGIVLLIKIYMFARFNKSFYL